MVRSLGTGPVSPELPANRSSAAVIIDTIKGITQGDVRAVPLRRASCRNDSLTRSRPPAQWKVLIVDEGSQRIIDNVVKEDDILNQNIASTCWAPAAHQSPTTADAV